MLGREFLGLIMEELGKSLAIDIGGDEGARAPLAWSQVGGFGNSSGPYP
jgi:hypothetical protein